MEDCHTLFPSLSHPMDIGSEIVSQESHLVRESSCTSVFESISIYYIFLIRVHLLTFRVCTCKKKRKKRKKWRKKKRRKEKNEHMHVCIQCLSPLSVCIVVEIHLNEFILLWVFVCELLQVLFSFCLSCYVCYMWESSDHFPTDSRLLSFPSFHTYVIWLFSMF